MTEELSTDKWSNETVLEFLNAYREEPVIWRASHPNHKNRNDIYDAWKRISVSMENQFSVNELKKKKDSLMASFRTCLAKIKSSQRSGAGSDQIYKPIWFAFNTMATFLYDKDEPQKTINSDDILSQLEENEMQNEPGTEIFEKHNTDITDNAGVVLTPTLDTTAMSSTSKDVPLRKKPKNAESENIKKQMDTAFSILQRSVAQLSKQKDLFDIYGELLATKLRALGEVKRETAMNEIDNLMFRIKMSPTIIQPAAEYSVSSDSPLTSPTPSLENDLENYIQLKLMNWQRKKIIKKGIVPHIFDCQRNRNTKRSTAPRSFKVKRQKRQLVDEILRIDSKSSQLQNTPLTLESEEVEDKTPLSNSEKNIEDQPSTSSSNDGSTQTHIYCKLMNENIKEENFNDGYEEMLLTDTECQVKVEENYEDFSRNGNNQIKIKNDQNTSSFLNTCTDDLQTQKTLNEYELFGEYVAQELKILKSEESRKSLKNKILETIIEITEEKNKITNINESKNFKY